MKIGPGVIAAAYREVRFDFDFIDRHALSIQFMLFHPDATVIILSHSVMKSGGFMEVAATVFGEILDRIVQIRNPE